MSKGSAYTHRARWPGFARRWQAEEAVGAKRLEFALARHAANLFSSRDLPPAMPVPPMSVDDILHNLYMHQHQTEGIGRAPGRCRANMPFEEAARRIGRAIDAIEGGASHSEAERA